MAELNGRACCILAICCDGPATRAAALSALMQKHAAVESSAADAAAEFVLRHFGVTTLAVETKLVEIAKMETPPADMGTSLVSLITTEYAPHRHQARGGAAATSAS